MLQAEYSRIAKAIDYISYTQSKVIIGSILEKIKNELGAMIVDVWIRTPGRGDVDILEPYLNKEDVPRDPLTPIALTPDATSLLVWVVEKQKPLWLDRIEEKATSAVDRLSGETINGRYMEVDNRTRSYAAIPIRYRGRLQGVLAVESAVSDGIQSFHVDSLMGLEEPTGILLWKLGVFKANRRHTDEAIKEFCSESSKSSTLNPYRTGFIARPFNPEADSLARVLKVVFREQGIRALSYSHVPGKGLVVGELLPQIRSAHFGIADVTGLNHNVLIELGAMLATNKPVILLRKQAEDPPSPFIISGYQIYTYKVTDTSSISSSITVSDPTSSRFLDDFVRTFVDEMLKPNKMFNEAKPWKSD